jgi:hypothetical protein
MIPRAAREASMTSLKLVLCATAAVLVAGLLVLKAEATPLTGAIDSHALGEVRSQVELAAHVRHDTLPGRHEMVLLAHDSPKGERKFCHCRPC